MMSYTMANKWTWTWTCKCPKNQNYKASYKSVQDWNTFEKILSMFLLQLGHYFHQIKKVTILIDNFITSDLIFTTISIS